ncbi:hemerythrin domain-containing protein [Saccharothrix coeruleofusca]|uniref:Hemerythrin n=1 Tax=Saccharothrix coeruleofusca TaxID=33919 RepID=A0A918ARM2_9PSEU|nr:hemerythrin domain-containing protein [Saccharothrix coeruleofusca]MBP2335848.1 hemerythrin superfamily protein [Saccharothrix coeruleofusca]GGP74798.1 hemerythrin [Saccharothrix coeruleofusca]
MAANDYDTDLIRVITADHRAVERLFQELESGRGTPQHRRALADRAISELARHAAAEEQFMYPAARQALPDGDEVADHELREHAEAEQVMRELEGLAPTDPGFDQLLSELIRDIRHHVAEEETYLLPRLAEHCSAEHLRELGRKVVAAKGTSRPRSHPERPLLHSGTVIAGRIGDVLSGRTR